MTIGKPPPLPRHGLNFLFVCSAPRVLRTQQSGAGVAVGIIVAVVLVAALAGVVIFLVMKRNKAAASTRGNLRSELNTGDAPGLLEETPAAAPAAVADDETPEESAKPVTVIEDMPPAE